MQICGTCIAISGCSANGPIITNVPEIRPSPIDSYINTVGGNYSSEYASQYGLLRINTAELNNLGYTEKGIQVAVVDTGIDASHSEFSGHRIQGTNFGNDTRG